MDKIKLKKHKLIYTGIISLFYFSISVLLYSSTGNIQENWDKHQILVWLMSLCPPSSIFFYSINFMHFHPFSLFIQFGLFLIGWAILYSIVLFFQFIFKIKNKRN